VTPDPLAGDLRAAGYDLQNLRLPSEQFWSQLARAAREHIAAEVREMGKPVEGEFRCTCNEPECDRCVYWSAYERIARRIARGQS
jgi:hypothetical protein